MNGNPFGGSVPGRLALGLLACTLASCDSARQSEGENGVANEATVEQGPKAVIEIPPPSLDEPGNAAAAEAPAPATEVPKAPAAAAAPWSPKGYRLIGTEPFWGGTVTPSRIVYSTPEDQGGEPVSVDVAYGASREIYSGTLSGKPFVLTLTKGPCSDGMSDNVHAFTATLQVRGETRQGCANPQ